MIRTGKLAISLMKNYIFDDEEKETTKKPMRRPGDITSNDKFTNNCKKLRALTKTLERAGGIFNKCAQMLSLYEEEKSVFSECVPFDIDKTKKLLTVYFNENQNNCRDFILSIEPQHYKSGSIGLIFRATSRENNPLIIKIRYNGLIETTQDDLRIVETLVKYMYSFVDFETVMEEISRNVLNELDFENECAQHQLLHEIWAENTHEIKIPKIYEKYCTENILVTEYIEGQDMAALIAGGSDTLKKKVVDQICYFVFKTLFRSNILYSDIHYGNFIVDAREICHVIDFGCIHYIKENTVKLLKQLFFDIKEGDDDKIFSTLNNIEIAPADISEESKQYLLQYIKFQYEPWTAAGEFLFTDQWLSISTDKNIDLMKEWTLPAELLYFNKIPFGLYHILTKLNVAVDYNAIMERIFQEN